MKKFHINTNPEKLSDAEIQKQMNFDSFVQGVKPAAGAGAKTSLFKSTKFYAWSAAAVVAAGITGFFMLNNSPEKTIPYVPFIQPPVAAMDIPDTPYEIESAADTIIMHTTGSLITIPAGTFAHADGKDVTGKVELRYREFHDPIDLVMSGIPMQYDSAGKSWTFESGGMFEIAAFQDGKPLQLKPEKTITVNMVSATNANNYNIYYLDTVARKWDYIQANTVENGTLAPAYTMSSENEAEFRAAEAADPVPVAPARPAVADPNAYNFTIDYLAADFPELEAYDNVKFQVDPNDKSYNPKLANKTWEDISIEKQDDGIHYTVTFRDAKVSHRFTVSPVVDGPDYQQALEAFESKNNRYRLSLQNRKQRRQQRMDSLYQVNEQYIGDSRRSQLNERLKTFITGNYNETNKDLMAFRTFDVRRLGIWNIDRPRDFFDNLYSAIKSAAVGFFAVKFVNKMNKPLLFRNVFLTKKGINSMYPIPEKDFGSFPAVTEQLDAMIGITYSNELYYVNDESLKQAGSKGKQVTLQMQQTGDNIKTTDDLRNLLKSGK